MKRYIHFKITALEIKLRELNKLEIFSPKGSLSYELKEFREAWIKFKIELLKLFL